MDQSSTRKIFVTTVSIFATTLSLLSTFPTDSMAETQFDHFTTGFRLEGAHRFAECETCHSDGNFAGTPTRCGECHAQASRTRATWRSPTHLSTTDRCDSCHRPNSWTPVIRFDHLEVHGACSSCHNNVTVAGQHPQHIQTTTECDDCHNTRAWR